MIYDRLRIDEKGNTFVPANVEGNKGLRTTKMWSGEKSTASICLGLGNIFICMWLFPKFNLFPKIITILVLIIIDYIIFDLFLIETPRFKKAFERLKKYESTTASIDYGIMSYNNQDIGTSVMFVDGMIGVFISLTRDSVVGKPLTYKEQCKTIFSDFLLNLNNNGYNILKCNIMNNAAQDKRFNQLKEEIASSEYKFIKNALALNVSKMLRYAEKAYYDQDIYMIYTNNSLKLNSIITECYDFIQPLYEGGFSEIHIMNEDEIIQLHIEENNTKSFDLISAKNEMFENIKSKREFEIYSIVLTNGNEFILTPKQLKKLNLLYTQYSHDKGKKIDILTELLNAEYEKELKKVTSESQKTTTDIKNEIKELSKTTTAKAENYSNVVDSKEFVKYDLDKEIL